MLLCRKKQVLHTALNQQGMTAIFICFDFVIHIEKGYSISFFIEQGLRNKLWVGKDSKIEGNIQKTYERYLSI